MSKPVKGEEALGLGLVDALVSPNELVSTARRWALEIVDRRRPWVSSLYKTDKVESLGEAREILKFARAQARKQAPNLKHPLVCIDVIEEGIVAGPRAGLWKVLIVLNHRLLSLQIVVNAILRCYVSNIGRKLKLFKDFCILILVRAWFISSLLNVERQRFDI